MPSNFRMLSVIIPVYNEESTINQVIAKVSAVDLPFEKEIIVVDDGSTDGTASQLGLIEKATIRHFVSPENLGKGSAVRIGLGMARGDVILIQDADLELDPAEYHSLLKPILDGRTAVVYGSRFLHQNSVKTTRRVANYFLTYVTNLLYRTNLTDMETAYKVFTSDIAKKLTLHAKRFEIEPELTIQFASLGCEIIEVPITYHPRTSTEGKKIRWIDGLKALSTLLRYKFVPGWFAAKSYSRDES
ncbi:MAG: glycosyltransferase family 2 protein [Acidobacteriota bacterium]